MKYVEIKVRLVEDNLDHLIVRSEAEAFGRDTATALFPLGGNKYRLLANGEDLKVKAGWGSLEDVA